MGNLQSRSLSNNTPVQREVYDQKEIYYELDKKSREQFEDFIKSCEEDGLFEDNDFDSPHIKINKDNYEDNYFNNIIQRIPPIVPNNRSHCGICSF
jgi:hypothetical protein